MKLRITFPAPIIKFQKVVVSICIPAIKLIRAHIARKLTKTNISNPKILVNRGAIL